MGLNPLGCTWHPFYFISRRLQTGWTVESIHSGAFMHYHKSTGGRTPVGGMGLTPPPIPPPSHSPFVTLCHYFLSNCVILSQYYLSHNAVNLLK